MRNATDLKQRMADAASELFRTQGYARTTNKQIADALGCTTAALYYYFPQGKRELLHAAAQTQTHLTQAILARVDTAQSPQLLLEQLGQVITSELANISSQSSWLYLEIDALEASDQRFVREQLLLIHKSLAQIVDCLLNDKTQSDPFAWLILSAISGYQSLFQTMGMHQLVPDFDSATLLQWVMRCIPLTNATDSTDNTNQLTLSPLNKS